MSIARARPFRIDIPDSTLIDLRERLQRTRLPTEPVGPPWRYGTSLNWIREVIAYWRDDYDWRKAEAELNARETLVADVNGLTIQFLVERGSGRDPEPLILTHGWPGSVFELLDMVDLLAHPERFGGHADDSFTVVVPSIPGFGFSQAPPGPISPREVAGLWHQLMRGVLGFDRYFAQGGDFGAVISTWMAVDGGDRLRAIHLNFAPMRPHLDAPPTPEEKQWLDLVMRRTDGELAYQQIQGTKSQTLAYALTDSPAGLAAWILEKFHGWTVPGSLEPPPFPVDRLISNVMLYWLAGINSANWMYRFLVDGTGDRFSPGERVSVPSGFLLFPNDILPPPPPAWLKRNYAVAHYRVAEAGGHFPCMEHPATLAEDIRSFFRPYRTT